MINIDLKKDELFGAAIDSNELYEKLGLAKNQYKRWCNMNIVKFGAYNTDYYNFNTMLTVTSTNIGKTIIYRLTKNFAKELCMISRTPQGKELREYLIKLDEKVQTSQLFSREQINFLFELVKVMGLFSIQDKAEKDHFIFHNNKYDWWDYRAKILGYNTSQLKNEVEKLNKIYRNKRQALIHIDRYELIRIGVIDLFISLGKTDEYAKNIAELCKDIAIQMKANIWNDYINNALPFDLEINKGLELSIKNNQLKLKE